MERCNKDVQCSGYLFNYTNQCVMAFSGDQMTSDQENVCEEAAKNYSLINSLEKTSKVVNAVLTQNCAKNYSRIVFCLTGYESLNALSSYYFGYV